MVSEAEPLRRASPLAEGGATAPPPRPQQGSPRTVHLCCVGAVEGTRSWGWEASGLLNSGGNSLPLAAGTSKGRPDRV